MRLGIVGLWGLVLRLGGPVYLMVGRISFVVEGGDGG